MMQNISIVFEDEDLSVLTETDLRSLGMLLPVRIRNLCSFLRPFHDSLLKETVADVVTADKQLRRFVPRRRNPSLKGEGREASHPVTLT